jgi:hypothetical protein
MELFMRLLLSPLLCLALAGCITADAAGDRVSGQAETAAAASAAKPGEPKKDDWWKQGGVTREKVSAMCWMKYEGRKAMSVDKRADLVNACVTETLKAHPLVR